MSLTIVLLIAIQPLVRPCLDYTARSTVLAGTIRAHTFPGRPNFESVARGDEPERVWLLHLDKRICVNRSDLFQKEKNVSRIQLVFDEGRKQYELYRPLLGRKVTIEGELFHSTTGHHHTRVLLTVHAIRKRQNK